jgi:membrane associated rhomboid family serine protease
MGMGVLGSAAVLNGGGRAMGNSPGAVLLVALIWIVIGIINVTYARRS